MTPAFADPAADARTLHVVSPDALADWLAAAPAHWREWLVASGFEAGLGETRLLPAPDGTVAAAVAGFGSDKARRRQRFGLARAAAALPAGNWRIEGDLTPAQRDEAALSFLLSGYRFDRYRKSAPKPAARLVCPEGCDAPRLLAMAEAEFLTRDLINTPAADMGPQELEEAFLSLATRFGAATQVIRGDDLLAQNFPMVHAVGRASPRAPRIMEMRWGATGPRLTLVGKGVCFDTGGLDIKPASGMGLMKKDMGGAATVMGLAQMIMALKLPRWLGQRRRKAMP